jgi:hypothetical protein
MLDDNISMSISCDLTTLKITKSRLFSKLATNKYEITCKLQISRLVVDILKYLRKQNNNNVTTHTF